MTSWGSWTRRCSCTSTMAMAAMPPRSSTNSGVSAQETYKIAGQSNLVQLIPVYLPFSSSSESISQMQVTSVLHKVSVKVAWLVLYAFQFVTVKHMRSTKIGY
jgi:hypothetical protein